MVHDDQLVWKGEPSGEFTVRRGYKLLTDTLTSSSALMKYKKEMKSFYKKLWSLNLPKKQKITTWKVSWDFLPTLANLKYRRLQVCLVCPICGVGVETSTHVFRECHVSIAVWNYLN